MSYLWTEADESLTYLKISVIRNKIAPTKSASEVKKKYEHRHWWPCDPMNKDSAFRKMRMYQHWSL